MAKILVQCTYMIEVEVPDGPEYDSVVAKFDIEENHCPGTGLVGAAFIEHMSRCERARVCWACALRGTNKIVG